MFNLAIGVILLIMSYIDYYIMKPKQKDTGINFRIFMISIGLANIILYFI